MPPSRLSTLQERILDALQSRAPGEWVLTGGAALAGFHTAHRTTRDLDVFWRARSELGDVHDQVAACLRGAGLQVEVLQSSPAFVRLVARSGSDSVIVDLVADPVQAIEPPLEIARGRGKLRVDTPHEILVNKLCAILERSELRDLVDVEAILARGGDLERALSDAPRKDGGFSPLTLSWILRELPLDTMARAAGTSEADARRLRAFRDALVARVMRAAEPPR